MIERPAKTTSLFLGWFLFSVHHERLYYDDVSCYNVDDSIGAANIIMMLRSTTQRRRLLCSISIIAILLSSIST